MSDHDETLDGQLSNTRAEQDVLGACFLDPATATWLDLEPSAFFDFRHRAIWESIVELVKESVPIDTDTVGDRIARRGWLSAVGGYAYLGELAATCVAPSNAEHYAKIVRSKSVNRRILVALAEIRDHLKGGLAEGEELLDEAVAVLTRIERPNARGTSLAKAVADEQHAIETHRHGDWSGIPTGIPALDDETGGLPIAVTSVLGARPSVGKSSLALAIARNTARETGRGVLILAYEDRAVTMAQRVLADLGDQNLSRVRKRELDLVERQAVISVSDPTLERVWVEHCHGLRIERAMRLVRAYRRSKDVCLVILDYLQKVPLRGTGSKNDKVEENVNRFDDTIAEAEIAGLLISQLNRECEKENRKPVMSDLRDSGSIEQVAKLIMFLHDNGDADQIELVVRKNHQGARQRSAYIPYDRAHCRIGAPPEGESWT